MMATKPRPSNDTTVEEEETPQVLSTDDKQADIERRLAMLGVPEETTSEEEEENEEAKDSEPEPEAPPMVVEEVAPPKEEETIPAPVPPTMTEAEEPKVELPVVKPVQPIEKAPEMKQPVVKAPTPASKSNKSALLVGQSSSLQILYLVCLVKLHAISHSPLPCHPTSLSPQYRPELWQHKREQNNNR